MSKWIAQPPEPTCQLVTMVNALIHYGLEPSVLPNTPEWGKIREDFGAMSGPLIMRDEALNLFGLEETLLDSHRDIPKLEDLLAAGIPIDIPTWDRRTGFHSALLVGKKGYDYTVVNPYGQDGPKTTKLIRIELLSLIVPETYQTKAFALTLSKSGKQVEMLSGKSSGSPEP